MGVTVSIVDYDTSWPERFTVEAAAIALELGPTARRIDHVGSTSVPGLAAKPIVDIQISVASLTPMDPYRVPLECLGYTYYEYPNDDGIDDYPYFAKPPEPPETFHIHVAEAGTFNERRHLAFRDWLRSNPDDAAAYAQLKRALAQQEWDDTNDYADAKTDFVVAIVNRALDLS